MANPIPFGTIDSVTAPANAITVTGWALAAHTLTPIQVHVYVDGSWVAATTADLSRPDVGAAFGLGNDHGYAVTVPASAGTHTVCTYGIHPTGGTNPLLACRAVTVTHNPAPFGNLESLTATNNSLTVIGWALDPDTTDPIAVHVYVDGTGFAVTANLTRGDVDRAFNMGANHGFAVTVPAGFGTHRVCVYAINTPAGDNPTLGCRTVSVAGFAAYAWGNNENGQLGDGSTTDRATPGQVGTDTHWASVAAAYDLTVAVKTGGTLWAWGANYSGQLGDGTTLNRSTPVQVGSDTNWASAAAGGDHTAALRR